MGLNPLFGPQSVPAASIKAPYIGDTSNGRISDRQNTNSRSFQNHKAILWSVSIRPIEQKRSYKAHRKLSKLVVVVVNYKGWKVVVYY